MKSHISAFIVVLGLLATQVACEPRPPDSDQIQAAQQEQILKEGSAQVGMPNIKNFRERKMAKDILELRDQEGLVTYTYLYSAYMGKFIFFCDSVGYPLPYATQFTSPEKVQSAQVNVGYAIVPQADPNGLFMPASADATWVMCLGPNKKTTAGVVYTEEKAQAFPWPLAPEQVLGYNPHQ